MNDELRLDIGARYVREIQPETRSTHILTKCTESGLSDLLHFVHPSAATCDAANAKDWTSCFSVNDHIPLGHCHAGHGLCAGLDVTVGFASDHWHIRGQYREETVDGFDAILTVGRQAGFFPGTVYLLSTWYTRYEVGKRYSFFYLIGVVASACGGILAFGLMQMEGLAGYGGWR